MPVSPNSVKIMLNLFLVYVSWGSTYIGFKLSMAVAGPFLVCGARMILAGLVICLGLILAGRWVTPNKNDVTRALWLGLLMVFVASGFLAKGQEHISSGAAAVVTGSTPISMLVAAWLFAGEERPTILQWLGLLGGLCGLILLGQTQGGGQTSLTGLAWVFAATLGWVAGSLLSRRYPPSPHLGPLQCCGLMLFIGGLESLSAGFLTGEAAFVQWQNLSPEVLVAFVWMSLGGSIIAYFCYFWLLANASIATAVSYEYVVPAIGIFLGWWLGGEDVTSRMILACCITVGSVFFVVQHKHSR